MKFLKKIMGKDRENLAVAEGPEMSIEALQRDLDQSGLDRALSDPMATWTEKASQRPVSYEVPDLDRTQGHDAALEPEDTRPDRRSLSRSLDWEDELGDAEPKMNARPAVESDEFDEDDGFEEDDGFDEFDEEDEFDELDPEEEQAIRANALLVDEIRDAIAAVRHIEHDDGYQRHDDEPSRKDANKGWENDEVFGRKAIARDRLARLSESEDGDRILEETNSKMYDDDAATRRRQAMAHLKAAAAATKADSVLKRVVGRDPAMDPDHQVQYREDLANVVRQRGPKSEPISRPLSRPRTRPIPADSLDIADEAAPRSRPLSKPKSAPMSIVRDDENQPLERSAAGEAAALEDETMDLRTALERQRAILKAEREALEAEIAAEDGTLDKTESQAPDDTADAEPEFEIEHEEEVEVEVELEDAAEFETEEPEEDEDFGDWDDGLAERVGKAAAAEPVVQAEEEEDPVAGMETDTPVDLSSLGFEEPEVEEQPVASAEESEPEVEPEAEPSETVLSVEPEEDTGTAAPAARRPAGRVKTRLLGFQAKSQTRDVFSGEAAVGAGPVRFPVGWLVVTAGEGYGHSFALLSGVSKIGRGDDQAVQLDFGDTSISRDNHAAIAFDEELNQFFLGHGGKSNVVRLNGTPVLSTEELYDGDEIRIGETTLKFIALCGEEFTWSENSGDDTDHVRSA